MASRTRDRLIDVARQLFVRKGVENTTMNDIATASDRGRRTLYTYFTSKNEIYQAVIDSEIAKIRYELDRLTQAQSSPGEKLRALINYRVRLVQNGSESGQLWPRSLLGGDLTRSQKVRGPVAEFIYRKIDEISAEGIASGEFDPEATRRLPLILTMLVRGGDWSAAHDEIISDLTRTECVEFILSAIITNKTK